MYSEGEDKYLKDLDWVNIVKSIRELKALTKIILNQYQRQILSFESESVLPNNRQLSIEEQSLLHNRVPLENSNIHIHESYIDEVEKFMNAFSSKPLSNLDIKLIESSANAFQNHFSRS